MPQQYEICADEAWTHESTPLNRYWCFYGGLLGEQSSVDRLESKLKQIVTAHSYRREIKWSNVKPIDLPLFKALVQAFFTELKQSDISYRQVFLDRSLIHVPSPEDPPVSSLDVQYKICYQFLKHAFGLKYLSSPDHGVHKLFIRLDRHSSQKHCDKLAVFVNNLGAFKDQFEWGGAFKDQFEWGFDIRS